MVSRDTVGLLFGVGNEMEKDVELFDILNPRSY